MTPTQLKKINEILAPTGTSFDEYGLNGRLQYIHRWACLTYRDKKFRCAVKSSDHISATQAKAFIRELKEIQDILSRLNQVMKEK